METLENEVFMEEETPVASINTKRRIRRTNTCPDLERKISTGLCPIGQTDDKALQGTQAIGRKPRMSTVKDMTKPKSGHLVFRRRSTQIVIREIPHGTKSNTRYRSRSRHGQNNAGDQCLEIAPSSHHEKDDVYFTPVNGVSWLCSGLYAMHVIILSLVICLTHYITEDISTEVVDYYFTALYILACAWLIGFRWLATSCYRKQPQFKQIKTNHTTNRWLKGILVVFGLGIIIENMMEFLEYFHIEEEHCTFPISAAVSVAQTVFVICEVNFIFRYSKVCLQENKFINRFGVMHIIATNLSVWILLVVIESSHRIHEDSQHHVVPATTPYHADSYTTDIIDPHHLEIADHIDSQKSDNQVFQPIFQMDRGYKFKKTRSGDVTDDLNTCVCESDYCEALYIAQGFLYPFVIEFSLIASCMMYLVWRNIGKIPPPLDHVIKPSYKFFKSYKGFLAGNIAIIATLIVIVVLNTSGHSSEVDIQTYETEIKTLQIHNIFLVILELLMAFSCIFCLVLFFKDPRLMKTESLVNLDAVLLIVTLVGVITIDMFYLLAVYASLASGAYSWIWGAIYPIVDMFQCVLQVGFITFGLSREPVTSDESKETAEKIRQTFASPVMASGDGTTAPSDAHRHTMRKRLDTLREICYTNEAYKEDDMIYAMERGGSSLKSSVSNSEGNKDGIASQEPKLRTVSEESYRDTKSPCSSNGDAKQTELPGYSKNDTESIISFNSSKAEGESSGVFMTSSQEGSGNFTLRKGPRRCTQQGLDWNSNDLDNKAQNPYYECSFIRPRLDTDASDGSRLGENSDVASSITDVITEDATFPPVAGKSTIAVVAKSRVSTPNKIRLLIRDFVMFLLICNASLWMFWSLHNTSFEIHDFPTEYYNKAGEGTRTTWTTIVMICLPLSIFFRMHSSACLFEVWSFA